jgi:hypothetical protein
VPTAILVTERFTGLAKAVATGKGYPNLTAVLMPLNPQFYDPVELERITLSIVDNCAEVIRTGLGEPLKGNQP